jgi:hypothetical protein
MQGVLPPPPPQIHTHTHAHTHAPPCVSVRHGTCGRPGAVQATPAPPCPCPPTRTTHAYLLSRPQLPNHPLHTHTRTSQRRDASTHASTHASTRVRPQHISAKRCTSSHLPAAALQHRCRVHIVVGQRAGPAQRDNAARAAEVVGYQGVRHPNPSADRASSGPSE